MAKGSGFRTWGCVSNLDIVTLIHIANSLAILFEGYSQGVIAGVNMSPDYIQTMNLSDNGGTVVTKQTKLGGIVAVYYMGSIWGAFAAGWLADPK